MCRGCGDRGTVGRVVGQRRRQHRDRQQFGRVRLGRRDRPLRSGLECDRPVGGGRQRGVGQFVMAMVGAPWAGAAAMTETMSGDTPDWLIPMTSVSAKSGATP